MSHGWRAPSTVVLAVALAALACASLAGQDQTIRTAARKSVATKPWNVSRTPDGQPDFQGTWVNNSATPLERPAALAGKALLTDQEVTDLKNRAARIFNDASSDFAAGDNAFLAVLANSEQYRNPNRTIENALEMEARDFDNRTSLVVMPADGKIPFTPEGAAVATASAMSRHDAGATMTNTAVFGLGAPSATAP